MSRTGSERESAERLVVGRTTLAALRRDGDLDLVSLGAFTSIGPPCRSRRRRSGRA